MQKSKFGKFIVLGALLGGAASLLDRPTRESVVGKSKKAISTIQYYGKNSEELKLKFQNEKEKYETMFSKFSEDAAYIKEKVDEIKELTPQIQELVSDTKEAFVESKDDYQAIVTEDLEAPSGK